MNSMVSSGNLNYFVSDRHNYANHLKEFIAFFTANCLINWSE
ncbi:hypothetical protein [Nostoc sp. FACHB-110]|nr:hypothetical protein [Nostoc sp. FACHB-110]